MGRPAIKDEPKRCKQCRKALTRKRFGERLEDRSNFRRRVFCDRTCMALYQLGESPSSHFLKRFRKGSCEKCGSSHLLQVHHANSNRSDNSPENLITLCARCHAQFHWANGKQHVVLCYVCGKPSYRWGLCPTHLTRLKRYGSPYLRPKRTGHRSQLYWDLGTPNGLTYPVLQRE